MSGNSARAVNRQMALSTAKAAAIAWQSIRLRLGRSLIAMSGIALAIAFLMYILCNDAAISAMRQWSRAVHQTVSEIRAAQTLAAMMETRGLATTPQQVLESATQRRWLTGLALLIAFVGVLNAMLMSVTERFREIGTMKCLGALDGFIAKLFLIESLLQGGAGAIGGVLLGLLLTLASLWITYGGYAWRLFPFGPAMASAGICLIAGVALTVAGSVYPAWRAARMAPIVAMRVDT